jgi:hypothetical protein
MSEMAILQQLFGLAFIIALFGYFIYAPIPDAQRLSVVL